MIFLLICSKAEVIKRHFLLVYVQEKEKATFPKCQNIPVIACYYLSLLLFEAGRGTVL